MLGKTRKELSSQDTEALDHQTRSALTVVIGTAQLLERRLARGASVSREETLTALESIRRHAWIVDRNMSDLRGDNCHRGDQSGK